MHRIRIFIIRCLFLFLIPQIWADESLVKNPGFDEGSKTFPDFWSKTAFHSSDSVTYFKWEEDPLNPGNKYVLIQNNYFNDARVIQEVIVSPGRIYRFSAMIKTEDVTPDGSGAVISAWSNLERSNDIKGTNDWQEAEIYIYTGPGVKKVALSLSLGFGGAESKGKAWFDNVQFEEVNSIPEHAVTSLVELPEEQLSDLNIVKPTKPLNLEPARPYPFFILLIIIIVCFIGIGLAIVFNDKFNIKE